MCDCLQNVICRTSILAARFGAFSACRSQYSDLSPQYITLSRSPAYRFPESGGANRVTEIEMGFLVPGSVVTPMGHDSLPAQRAARSAWQKASSCFRFLSNVMSSLAASRPASFHLSMTPSPDDAFSALPYSADDARLR